MRTTLIVAATVAATLAVPAAASAHDGGSLKHQDQYLRAKVKALGASPGRDIIRYGRRPGKDSTVREYLRTMRRMIAPPPAPVATVSSLAAAPATAPATASISSAPAVPSSGGGYAIPADIVQCESGGSYTAVNPSSGARGAYQVLGSTHAAICPDLGWSPGEQDACAARIWQQQGRGAWSC